MIPIKIQCGCGQRYSFEIEPVNGRMPSPVACPVCGADGTSAANEIIAQKLASQTEVPQTAGVRLRPVPRTATPPPVPPAIPPHPSIPPPVPTQRKLAWYEHLWIALPVSLVGFGGAIGGACGGAAWAINRTVFARTRNPVLRYLWTGLISAGGVGVYLVLAFFVLSLFRSPGKTVAAQDYHWKKFATRAGNFRVLFPGKPKEVERTKLFLKLHSYVFDADKTTAFMVSFIDYPKRLHIRPTQRVYDGARNGALGKDGKLVLEKSMTIEGYPAREIQVQKNGGKAFIVDRYFLAGNRLYQVMAVVPSLHRSSTNIAYFLNSFGLLNKSAL